MIPLIALVVVTLGARVAGWMGLGYTGTWTAATAVGLAAMFIVTGVAHFVQPLRSGLVAIVPLSTYTQRLVGGSSRNAVNSIYVKATSSETLSAAYQETDALLLNLHHITEICFKAFAKALRMATTIDPRAAGVLPSTKGSL